jgi:hypothetical protein
MRWKKLGLIFTPPRQAPWMISHASNPAVEQIDASRFRVYFNCRDDKNRGSLASFDFDPDDPHEISNLSPEALLSPGQIGTFDDSGISMGCLVKLDDGTRYLYYLGWNLGVTVPWRNSIGLAIAQPNSDKFERHSQAPILDRHALDPFSLSYPWVLRLGEHNWLMWYGSNLTWGAGTNDMDHVIKVARSQDGINWHRDGTTAIPLKPGETGISRPCVLMRGKTFCMWYSLKTDSYAIGYAESNDGLTWIRQDENAGIHVSESGWDSDAICYPCVFDAVGRKFMLYNGNNYGGTGIGLAVLESD